MSPVIRIMNRHDIEPAFALEKVLYPADAWSMGQFIEELAGVPETRYYIALDDDGTLIGYAGLMCPHQGADADIQTLSVAPDRQGQGHGQALLDALVDEAFRRKAPSIFLEVRVDNEAALGLYAKNDFEVLGKRQNYYGPGIDATTMRKELVR